MPRSQRDPRQVMSSADAERDAPCGRDVWLRQVMSASGTFKERISSLLPQGKTITVSEASIITHH